MPSRIASVNGDWTAAGTWKGVLAASSGTQEQLTGTLAVAVTTTQAPSATFQVGSALACDGVVFQIASLSGSPDGNLEVQLYDGVTVHRQVDIAASVLPVNGGWILVSWASFTMATLTNYRLRLRRSASAGFINCFVSSGTLWNKSFRGTATGIPATGERIFISGEFTGGVGITARTVTMNHFSTTTDHGALEIGKSGTLSFKTDASTILKASGALNIWDGGTLNVGTQGTPIGSAFTADFLLDCSSLDGETGIVVQNGGTLRAWGHQRWSNNLVKTKLTVQALVGATSLTIADNTGWLSGDVVVIAGTTRSATADLSEGRALTANAGASSLAVAALTNYHAGVAPIQAEVINLTRNCKLRASGTASVPTANPPTVQTFACYLNAKAGSIVDLGFVEFAGVGSFTTGKRGIEIETTTGSFSMQRCSLNGSRDHGIYILGAATNNITITECVGFNLALDQQPALIVSQTSGTAISITNCTLIRCGTVSTILAAGTNAFVGLMDLGLTFTGNTLVGAYYGLKLDEEGEASGVFSGNTIHNAGAAGIIALNARNIVISSLKIYRCGDSTSGSGLLYSPGITGAEGATLNHRYESPEIFGCRWGINFGQKLGVFGLIFNLGKFHGSGQQDANDTAAPSTSGVFISGVGRVGVEFNECEFGTTAANKTQHTSGDIEDNSGYSQMVLRSCQLASPIEIVGQTSMIKGSSIKLQRNDNTAGSHRALYQNGTLARNATVFYPGGTGPPSEEMAPNSNCSATNRLESGKRRIAVFSGGSLAPKVWVQKDASYAGGTQPRLIVKKNIPLGITADTVLDTMTAGATTWEQMGGTPTAVVTDDGVLEFCVDIDATAGRVYLDDWSAS
jgi:hypothetical protein